MTRNEFDFLKDCVITIVADDYENFEMVLKETKRLAASRRIKISENEVAEALQVAIADWLCVRLQPFSLPSALNES